jgi:hypothetical protein
LQSQQEQIELLKEELAKRDHQMDEARETAASANAHAAEASAKAGEAANVSLRAESSAAVLNSAVADLKASNDALKKEAEAATGQAKSEDGPASIKYKGVTFTPGGFFAAESVYRTRAASSDINTPFTGTPFPNNGLGKVSEFNATGRQSRLSFLFEGKADNFKLSGYYELDWLGACATSNNRQSNSYCMRQRQIWGQAAVGGWTFTGGQMWSLATETKKGLDNRTENLPMTIDPQYSVGFTWARQYGFRVTKNIGDKFWLGASIEGPQATIGGRGTPTGLFAIAPGSGGGLFNATDSTGYSVNATPDFIVKAAWEPGFGHYELFGVLSTFRARVYPCDLAAGSLTVPTFCATDPAGTAAGAFNDTRTAGGGGFNARMPIIAKKADLGFHIFGGSGVGRYSSAQLADVTVRPDGTLAPIKGGSFLGTLELHPTPKFDIYFNYGAEYAFRTEFNYINLAGTVVPVGYGNPLFNNSGCESQEQAPVVGTVNGPASNGTCNGDLRNVQEATLGFWHQIYKGPKGGIRWGIQYSYLVKNSWSGNNNTPTAVGVNAKGIDNMVFTSFRYYIP